MWQPAKSKSNLENVDYKALYHNALANPASVDRDALLALINRFPYAQALRMAKALKTHRESGSPSRDGGALLFAKAPSNWVYGYITTGILPGNGQMDDKTGEIAPAADTSGLMEHPAGIDYFAYDDSMPSSTDEKSADGGTVSTEVVPLAEATPHEKVSLYNDDHLPYSFLWWLNKTRMEYAATYRPYAPASDDTIFPADLSAAPDDERVLDHQIRENIFHLQSPEDKLSPSAQPLEPVPFQIPKKTDHIIERFIREEPQIKPPQADKINLENKARKSAEDQLTLVTETLANIYVEQGLYPKAIAIYKKLSLKYPEKSTYFAARITELTDKLP